MSLGIGMTSSGSNSGSSDAEINLAFLQQFRIVSLVTFNQPHESMCRASKTENLFATTLAVIFVPDSSLIVSIILARIPWPKCALSVRITPISQGWISEVVFGGSFTSSIHLSPSTLL